MNTINLIYEHFVKARPALVYHAFTNATALREWMCDVATTHLRPGGRVYMAWNSGFYMSGEFLCLEADREILFTWNGRGEPAPTQVRVKLTARDGGTQVELTHEQVGTSKKWAGTIKEINEGWKSSLENLVSVLESGADLRLTLRPMMGVYPGEFDAAIAQKLGVPVEQGMRLAGVVDGMGAQAAGLQAEDVFIRLAGREIHGYPDLAAAIQGHRAGDKVEVVFYRGSQKLTTTM